MSRSPRHPRRLRVGLLLGLAALFCRAAAPVLHGRHVAASEAALDCHVSSGMGAGIVSEDKAGHAGHHHHDANSCPVERVLLGGGSLLPDTSPGAGSSPAASTSLGSFQDRLRSAAPEESGHSPRGPPAA